MRNQMISDTPYERLEIVDDNERYAIKHWNKHVEAGVGTDVFAKTIILNPREAQEIADFITAGNSGFKPKIWQKGNKA